VLRTTCLISGLIAIPFLRDLLLPGVPLSRFPFDLNYLTFTRAYVHSPDPEDVERHAQAAFFLGDKLSSQASTLDAREGILDGSVIYKVERSDRYNATGRIGDQRYA